MLLSTASSKKISTSMTTMSKQLKLIADNLVSGKYDNDFTKPLSSVKAAQVNCNKALALIAGKINNVDGLVKAINASKNIDPILDSILQVHTTAKFLQLAMEGEIEDDENVEDDITSGEDEEVTDEITSEDNFDEAIDSSEEHTSDPDHNMTDEMPDSEKDSKKVEAEDDKEDDEKEDEEITSSEDDEEEDEDLGEETTSSEDDEDEIELDDLPEEKTVSKKSCTKSEKKNSVKASVKKQTLQKSQSNKSADLTALWSFK